MTGRTPRIAAGNIKNMLVNAEMTIGQVVDAHPADAANVRFIVVFEMGDAPAEKAGGFVQLVPAQPAFFLVANLEQPLLVACRVETEAVQKRSEEHTSELQSRVHL